MTYHLQNVFLFYFKDSTHHVHKSTFSCILPLKIMKDNTVKMEPGISEVGNVETPLHQTTWAARRRLYSILAIIFCLAFCTGVRYCFALICEDKMFQFSFLWIHWNSMVPPPKKNPSISSCSVTFLVFLPHMITTRFWSYVPVPRRICAVQLRGAYSRSFSLD